jgi:hypothetical protein
VKFGRTDQVDFGMIMGFDNLEVLKVDEFYTTIEPIQSTSSSAPTTSTVSSNASESTEAGTTSRASISTTSETATTITNEQVNELLYFCDFDSFLVEKKSCNGVIEIVGTVNMRAMESVSILRDPKDYYITDLSSISMIQMQTFVPKKCLGLGFGFGYNNFWVLGLGITIFGFWV